MNRVSQVLRASLERQVLREFRESKDQRVRLAHKANRVLKENRVRKENREFKDYKAPPDLKAKLAYKVRKEKPALRVNGVKWANPAKTVAESHL